MKNVAPTAMSRAERLVELGEILAASIQRHFAHQIKSPVQPRNCEKQLDAVADGEAPCGPNSMEATT